VFNSVAISDVVLSRDVDASAAADVPVAAEPCILNLFSRLL